MKTFEYGNFKFEFYRSNTLLEYHWIDGKWILHSKKAMNYKQAYNYLLKWCKES